MRCVVCHYGEIGTKGKNRRFFEKRLLSNLKEFFPKGKVSIPRGRVVLLTGDENVAEKLKKIPGIAYFFFAEKISSEKKEIEKKIVSLAKKKEFENFRVTVKRSDKSFPLSSQELSAFLGRKIIEEKGKKVNLFSPEINFFVEINSRETYIYLEKIKGLGGLPVGTGGKVVSLLSGGIDSPVSSFFASKRGVKNIFVHFHAYPSTSKQSIEKTERIVKVLSGFQGDSVLYLVPFNNIQKEIMLNTRESVRVLLYRRLMMKIGERIARKESAKAMVSGESLGQVASQTIENIAVTSDAVNIPVFRPLIGFDKEEIIRKAKEIGTYEISILPEEDCCVRFVPKHPETKGKVSEIKEEENSLQVEELIEDALSKTERKKITP